MISNPSGGDIARWTESFRRHQALEAAALRRRDIPAANRHAEMAGAALRALSEAGVEGRSALEELMQDADPSTRGRAASEVISWDPNRAIPVLARLLHEQRAPESVSVETVGTQLEAQHALQDYFGLDLFDARELPGRLSQMGIDLPEKTARRLRREV